MLAIGSDQRCNLQNHDDNFHSYQVYIPDSILTSNVTWDHCDCSKFQHVRKTQNVHASYKPKFSLVIYNQTNGMQKQL